MKQYLYQKIKEVALIISGGLISVTFTPYGNLISKYLLYLIIIIIILLLFGAGIIEFICAIWIWLNRKFNNLKKQICIYAPYEIDKNNSSWVNISISQLKHAIKSKKFRCSITLSENEIFKYPFVINPFGGVYPEKDISDLRSLNKIFDYVKNGGIYINIADIPFYYAYDTFLHRKVDTTPLAGDFSQIRSFFQTILTKKLHCFVYGLTSGEDFNKGITRIISLADNSINFFHKEIIIKKTEKFSPFLAIPYGRGYFVFSTLQVNKGNIDNLIEIIKKSINL